MAKKRASNQPIVAEEPLRPDEQFQLDESEVAPPSSRPVGPQPRVTGSSPTMTSSGVKTYGARSAKDRRTPSAPASGSTAPRASAPRSTAPRSGAPRRERRGETSIRPDIVMNMLENPTITVTEEELHKEYNYVISDLRSMAILAVILVVGLIIVAQLLPK